MLIFNIAENKKYVLGIGVLVVVLIIIGIIVFGGFARKGIYFSDSFDSVKKEWSFYHNGESNPATADIVETDGNKMLKCTGPCFAKINKEWEDYSLKFRFKRIEGSMIVNFKDYRSPEENSQYWIGLGNDKGTAINLSKQINANFNLISQRAAFAHYEGWHTLEVRVRDNIINIFLDDNFLIKYQDREDPIRSGGVSFSVIANSEFLIDDVEIKSVNKEDVVIEAVCPYHCCVDDFFEAKPCSAGLRCYANVCQPESQAIELLEDITFERGLGKFTESNLSVSQWCEMPINGQQPAWEVSEIATETHFCQNLPNPKSTEPVIIFESQGGHKKLISYKNGSIKLQLNTSAEEKEGCVITNEKRPQPGSTWPYYGVIQHKTIDFADFDQLNFTVEAKLNKFEPLVSDQRCTEYGAKINRYGGFGIVFLLKRTGEGYGPENLYWLLIDTCSKHWWGSGESDNKECEFNSEPYVMADDFGIPMYHPAMDNSILSSLSNTHPVLKEGQWVSYNVDLKEFAQEGIDYFNTEYGARTDLADYQLAHIDLAWEIIGAFDTEIELRNFSLKGVLAQ